MAVAEDLRVAQLASARRDEVKDLVAHGEIDRAMRRVLDFSKELGTESPLINQAIETSSRLSRQKRDEYLHGASAETSRNLSVVVEAILMLVDAIGDAMVGAACVPDQSSIVVPAHAARSAETGRSKPAEKLTALELARRAWSRVGRVEENIVFSCGDVGRRLRAGLNDFHLRGVNLTLRRGEITGIVGSNGSGKTTLLRLVAGHLRPDEGELQYFLANVGGDDLAGIRDAVGYVEQAPPVRHGTLGEVLRMWAALRGVRGAANKDEVNFVLQRFGLGWYASTPWQKLSGGHKMRAELAMAFLTRPELLLLDEPLAPLDVVSQRIFLQDLRDLADSVSTPIAIVVSSQHLYEIEAMADRLVALSEGRLLWSGATRELGESRTQNVFEIGTRAPRAKVEKALSQTSDVRIESLGGTLTVKAGLQVKGEDILRRLLAEGVEVAYFRDISCSTRSILFSEREGG